MTPDAVQSAVAPRGRAGARAGRSLRVAVVGVSASSVCGARDHADGLVAALAEEGVECSTHWFERSRLPARAAAVEIHEWARTLPAELAGARADVVLLHYSVFSYSYRGVPLFVRTVLSPLREAGLPLVTVLHEFAFPWDVDGLRGKVWAVTQRVLLIDLLRASAGVVLTTEFREEWLASRVWLPRRPAAVAPVFSNLPPPRAALERSERVLGMFGYSYPRSTARLVLDALRLVRGAGLELELELLGAPGAGSPVAEMWLAEAAARGLENALRLSGTLPAQELSDALARCALLVFADPSGPSSRKTTLAASLASGTAVIALDGPRRWERLRAARAAQVAEPAPDALAAAIHALAGDPAARAAVGARGREFAHEEMSAHGSAEVVGALLEQIAG